MSLWNNVNFITWKKIIRFERFLFDLVYLNPNSSLINFPMLIDRIFQFEKSFRKTGITNGIEIKKLQ